MESFRPIVTRSKKVLGILREAELHARSDMPILITGETGTGKELLAKSIHAASSRSSYRFTAINMGAHTGTLFDAEFFGHTRGAFTGAVKTRVGYLEHTNNGTLFMDEIGNLPFDLQGKLLRFLEHGEFFMLGTNVLRKTNVRVIAATNQDLERLIAKRLFREDLYYRLKGGWLHLPPLKDRMEDIPLLADCFLKEFCGPSARILDGGVLDLLMQYDYPGNIRELRSIIQSAVNLAQGKPISVNVLPSALRNRNAVSKINQKPRSELISLDQVVKTHILKVYGQTERNKTRTARLLGIGLNTLRRKLVGYGIT